MSDLIERLRTAGNNWDGLGYGGNLFHEAATALTEAYTPTHWYLEDDESPVEGSLDELLNSIKLVMGETAIIEVHSMAAFAPQDIRVTRQSNGDYYWDYAD